MAASTEEDDFSRRVYCVLGVPVDDINMAGVVSRIRRSASTRSPLFLSTPNLNFLMLSQRDPAFRRSLLESDLCPADGVGVLLVCRLLGIPIASRVAGSDLPVALRAIQISAGRALRVALLGGEPGIGELARKALNRGDTKRLECVAAIDPGVVTLENIHDHAMAERINATQADFLIVALGAQKGQAWLMANRPKLTVPIVSHLGATLNYLAGTVQRAPKTLQRLGLEWLWRIKEEPKLARRYASDGGQLMWLLLTRVLPLILWLKWPRADIESESGVSLDIFNPALCTVTVSGVLRDEELAPVIKSFRSAGQSNRNVQLDLSRLKFFQMGFAGQVLMLEKTLQRQGRSLTIAGYSASVARALGWCGLGYLREGGARWEVGFGVIWPTT